MYVYLALFLAQPTSHPSIHPSIGCARSLPCALSDNSRPVARITHHRQIIISSDHSTRVALLSLLLSYITSPSYPHEETSKLSLSPMHASSATRYLVALCKNKRKEKKVIRNKKSGNQHCPALPRHSRHSRHSLRDRHHIQIAPSTSDHILPWHRDPHTAQRHPPTLRQRFLARMNALLIFRPTDHTVLAVRPQRLPRRTPTAVVSRIHSLHTRHAAVVEPERDERTTGTTNPGGAVVRAVHQSVLEQERSTVCK